MVEDFKEEEEEDMGIGFAKTAGLTGSEVFTRLLPRSFLWDDVPDLARTCGRLDVGMGGGVSERGGVLVPAGEGLSEVDGLLLTVLGSGRFCGWEVVVVF